MVKYFYDKHQIGRNEEQYYLDRSMYDWAADFSNVFYYLDSAYYGRIKFSTPMSTGTPNKPYYLFSPTNNGGQNYVYRYDTNNPNSRFFRLVFYVETSKYEQQHIEIRVTEKKGNFIETIEAEDGAYPSDGVKDGFWYVKKGIANQPPTVTLSTANNQTLYENTAFTVNGSAKDTNAGDVVSTYYSINGGAPRAMTANVSDGAASIPFNEQLTFKSGKLFKADTAVSANLTEGTAHTLDVWAEDNKGGKSAVQTRTFYVVPNRPPTLTVNPITSQSGMIKSDKVMVSGTSNDPDGNNVKVAYRLNGGAPVEIYDGPAGAWSFDLTMTALKDGENAVVVEVSDTYNVKVSRTVKINKSVNSVAIAPSVQRYQILTETSAKKVQFWVRRHLDQTLTADVSMTGNGDAESYAAMTLVKSVDAADGSYVEDEFTYETSLEKEKIILKLTLANDKPVFSITGALY